MRLVVIICLALAALTLAVYSPALSNGFVSYDDPTYVTENPHVLKGLNCQDALWAFTTNHAGNWHPLTWLSHMADVSCFGVKAAGHHFASALFHALNTVLLFLALRLMTGALWRSTIVAALFALHPIHVESVAWVAERKDVLSTFFFLLTLIAYTVYSRRANPEHGMSAKKGWIAYASGLLFFACGLLSKPMLVTLPFVLLLLDYWPLGRIQAGQRIKPGLLLEKIPFFALSLASCVTTFLVQRGAGAVSSTDTVSAELRIANTLVSYVRYLGKMFWPSDLAVIYPLPRFWPALAVVGAAALLLAITACALWRFKPAPYVAVGWFWYLGTLVPVVGLVQVGQQAMADRYSYIPLIGVFIALTWAVAEIPARWPATRTAFAGLAAVLLAACAMLAWRQIGFWRDDRSLFAHALEVTHDNEVAENNFGVVLLGEGKREEAKRHFQNAIRIRSGSPDALANLAQCEEASGDLESAMDLLERSLRSRPTPGAHYNFANLLTKKGRLAEAEKHYQLAIQLNPSFADAWFNLGVLHAKLGLADQADSDFAAALRLKPGNAQMHLTLGATLASQNKIPEAIAEFNTALRLAPDNPDAHYNLALILQNKGDLPGAEAQYAEACRLRPDDLAARKSLGFVLLLQGKLADAVTQLQTVIQNAPDPEAHYYLALALDSQGQFKSALEQYRAAVRLAGNAPQYLNDLAWLLATCPDDSVRNGAEAVALAEKANQLAGGKEARFLGTLDAAYAEAGRFDDAVATAEKTQAVAVAAQHPDIARLAEERIALYRTHKPYHQQRAAAP